VSIAVSAIVLVVILAAAGLILQDAKNSIFESTRQSAEVMSKRIGAAMFPREDIFSIHMLVNTMKMDKLVKYAIVSDQKGFIRSHSEPEKIGALDGTPQGEKARRADAALTQSFKGGDGLDYFYFSEPITVGGTRIGTAALAINTETMKPQLEPVKEKLFFIFAAAFLSLILLLEIRNLTIKERNAAALKSAMVHAVSHEFNNALSVIDASVFMLKESEPQKTSLSREDLYQTLEYEQNFLKRMVKNILNEARMEAGKFKIEKRPLLLRDIVSRSLAAMHTLAQNKKISFSRDLPENPVPVNADPEALALVISNLVGNAIKYTPEKGQVVFRLKKDAEKAGYVTFFVENSGAGISEKDISLIKEGFYRSEDAKSSAEGFGLGLKICNEMLELHGARLELKSEPGKSACFYFTLPIMTEKELRAASTISAPSREIRARNGII